MFGTQIDLPPGFGISVARVGGAVGLVISVGITVDGQFRVTAVVGRALRGRAGGGQILLPGKDLDLGDVQKAIFSR